jgi:predicted RNase H-like nuclease (RuvC/YqgF family)
VASDANAPSDEGPSLESLRRELEREFENKRREAKNQEKRLREKLEADRADWEARRRQQTQELANQKEALRRQLESVQQQAQRRTRQEIELRAKKEELGTQTESHAATQAREAKRVAALERIVATWRDQRGLLGLGFGTCGLVMLVLTFNHRPAALPILRGVATLALVSGWGMYAHSRWMQRPASPSDDAARQTQR